MISISISVDGGSLANIKRELMKSRAKVYSGIKEGLMDSAQESVEFARGNIRSDTGKLASSFKITPRKMKGPKEWITIGNTQQSALWVEFGTGLRYQGPGSAHGLITPKQAQALGPITSPHWEGPRFLAYSRGQEPNPFMSQILKDDALHAKIKSHFKADILKHLIG